jgi:hypothetical protein
MMLFNVHDLPPICMDAATDMLSSDDASPIETAVATSEVYAATISKVGSIAFVQCRVSECPVKCRIFHSEDTPGSFRATGVSSEAGATDLSNCVK